MKPMVLVFNHFAQPPTSPGGTRHIELFSRLDHWDARIIAADRNLLSGAPVVPEGILETVSVTPYSGNGPARIINWVSYALTSFARGVRARRVDVVYGSSPHLLAALSAWLVARLRRVPFVLEIRDVWPRVLVDMGAMSETSIVYRALQMLERFLYRRADRIVIMAEGVHGYLVGLGVEPEGIEFIPNGADTEDFQPTADRDSLRERYGFDGVVAIYAGAHGPANGLDLLLDAAQQVAEAVPALTIVLVGDGARKPELVESARIHGVTNVTFLDPVPKSEIKDLFAAADIGVHCLADVELFRSGVSPNKLYDYMAAGLPVITNTPGEVSGFVNASGGGVAVEPTGLTNGLSSLALLPAVERARLGQAGSEHLAGTRSRTAMAQRIENILDEVSGKST
jgi:glycosyltransferase involved in cell wall biosynthesis